MKDNDYWLKLILVCAVIFCAQGWRGACSARDEWREASYEMADQLREVSGIAKDWAYRAKQCEHQVPG